ncbi:MAG TPA: DUF3679 domain-containing protein [Candidatus Angelobacter sp.]|nr:DUF3679 domain-containing protein [Candidatus Angelobacter sp.]
MKSFLIKTIILITVLFLCVIYGMEMAKHSMSEMEGSGKSGAKSLVAQLAEPLVSPDQKTASTNTAPLANEKKSPSVSPIEKNDSMSTRIQRMETIQDFNPYSSLGESLSNGLQVAFSSGMATTTNLFGHLVKHIF